MKSIFRIFLFVMLFIAGPVKADEYIQSKFTEANAEYRKGNFSSAATLYENILKKGMKSGELYYNLGNCYFKTGEIAKSILAYERAKKFMPDDEDLAYNLRLSYSNTVDKIDPVPQLFYERWWTQLLTLMSPSAWSVLAIILLWLAAGIAAWYLYAGTVRMRQITFLSGGIFIFLAIFFFAIASSSFGRLHKDDAAVVMEPSSVIRSSPDDKSTSLFMLHAGTKIEIVDELGSWKQIRIANGNTGWIKQTSVEQI